MGRAAVRQKITRRQIEEADQPPEEDLIPVFQLNEEPEFPPPAVEPVVTVPAEWVVEGDRTSGSVSFLGRPAFRCLYTRLSAYQQDEFSQDLTVHDQERSRVFHDFYWIHREAEGRELDDLVKVMQRQVAALVGR